MVQYQIHSEQKAYASNRVIYVSEKTYVSSIRMCFMFHTVRCLCVLNALHLDFAVFASVFFMATCNRLRRLPMIAVTFAIATLTRQRKQKGEFSPFKLRNKKMQVQAESRKIPRGSLSSTTTTFSILHVTLQLKNHGSHHGPTFLWVHSSSTRRTSNCA